MLMLKQCHVFCPRIEHETQNKKKQNPTKKRRVAAESDTSSEVSKMHVFDDMTIRTESIDETHAEGENCVLGDLA
ncbi:uncharacterized protein [Periplaneta americana]|uniref:uncharacterized protein isoform X2 n=1 Tax=Periplaneta americana TaxID=6978 RepID=UPI0037E7C78A